MTLQNLKVLQVNLNRNSSATESALQLAIELDIQLILIQEPWIIYNEDNNLYRSVNHPGFIQILPPNPQYRPRTLAYITKSIISQVSLAPESPSDPDLLILNIKNINSNIQIINIYNKKDQGNLDKYTLT